MKSLANTAFFRITRALTTKKMYYQVRFNIWAQKSPPMRHAPGA